MGLEGETNGLFSKIDLVICIDDPTAGPFFKQKRVGRHGEEFYMYKFRTMRPNAEQMLDQLKDQSIWLAGHTHSVRTKDLLQGDGRTIHLKLNPVGYPDENTGNAERMDEFLLEK